MKSLLPTITLALVLSLLVGSAFAWGQNGHRIIGDIAQDTLTPEATAGVEAIAGARSLALLSTWPDFVRSFPAYDCFKPWHFLTVEDGQSMEEARKLGARVGGECQQDVFKDLNMPNNVVDAIDFFEAILRGDNQKKSDFTQLMEKHNAAPLEGSIQLSALALLVHLVGDVHQPLHVGRGPDRGGNTITVEWFDTYVKLHAIWDTEIIEREQLSYTEFADFLRQDFSGRPEITFGNGVETWANESVDVRDQVYSFGGNPNFNIPRIGYEYAAENNQLLKTRLYSGGIRLGEILNRIFQ